MEENQQENLIDLGVYEDKGVCPTQALQLEVIKRSSFNNLDGEQVVKDLLTFRSLWKGVIIDRMGGVTLKELPPAGWVSIIDLIKLRDISNDSWNVDTLFIESSGEDNSKLELLAYKMGADDITWISDEKAAKFCGVSGKRRVLKVWWD